MESRNQKQTKEPLPLPTQIVLGLTLGGLAFFTYQSFRERPVQVHSDDPPPCLYWVGKVGENCKQTKTDQCEHWQDELNKCLENVKIREEKRKQEDAEYLKTREDEWNKNHRR